MQVPLSILLSISSICSFIFRTVLSSDFSDTAVVMFFRSLRSKGSLGKVFFLLLFFLGGRGCFPCFLCTFFVVRCSTFQATEPFQLKGIAVLALGYFISLWVDSPPIDFPSGSDEINGTAFKFWVLDVSDSQVLIISSKTVF